MEWCHPGDDDKQRWVLMFEDDDRGMSIYFDKDEAHDAFKRADFMGWNCHLLTSVRRDD